MSALSLLQLFFKLFKCADKALRALCYKHILSDIRRMNQKQKSAQVNCASGTLARCYTRGQQPLLCMQSVAGEGWCEAY